jgi:hypothetical protein
VTEAIDIDIDNMFDLADRYGKYCYLCGEHGESPFGFLDWILKGEPFDLDCGGVAELQAREQKES